MNAVSTVHPPTPPSGPPAEGLAVPPKLLSQELQALLMTSAPAETLSVGELFEATRGRGYHLLLILIALPFVGPIPLPGFSLPFGLVVAVMGTRLLLDQSPWLPQRLLEREIPKRSLVKIVGAASSIMRGLEWFLRPRLHYIPDHAVFSRIAGLLVAISGLLLMLPLPLPFSNSLPAWTVLFLSAGSLGRDGLFFLAGCASFLVSGAFFSLVALGGVEAFHALLELLRHWAFPLTS